MDYHKKGAAGKHSEGVGIPSSPIHIRWTEREEGQARLGPSPHERQLPAHQIHGVWKKTSTLLFMQIMSYSCQVSLCGRARCALCRHRVAKLLTDWEVRLAHRILPQKWATAIPITRHNSPSFPPSQEGARIRHAESESGPTIAKLRTFWKSMLYPRSSWLAS